MNVILNKIESIKRCIARIDAVYDNREANLDDPTRQDSIVLNLQRACEQSIDLANYIISRHDLGIPQSSRDAFLILLGKGVIDQDASIRMQKMVGFRNIAIHDYQALDPAILRSIITGHLKDFASYTGQVLAYEKK